MTYRAQLIAQGMLQFHELQRDHEGLISFYVDDDAEILYIFNLVWAG
ncbi:hypothetical protein BKA15_000824 [Microlunatus parietis]|uniref:XisI protein n=1 Tax=Microlunatus parietis TaxID=682979 RepID=A0A7Y9LAB4_9ACTN|nr:hypothetical protein [Microlunatus parietis]